MWSICIRGYGLNVIKIKTAVAHWYEMVSNATVLTAYKTNSS